MTKSDRTLRKAHRTVRKPIQDLRLKIAIIESRKTQRRVAIDTRLGELRLSQIVRREGPPATWTEQVRLSKYLQRPRTDLFPADVIELADQERALVEAEQQAV